MPHVYWKGGDDPLLGRSPAITGDMYLIEGILPPCDWCQAQMEDKGYDYDHLRKWLRKRGIVPRIARRGVESSARLGRHRWVVERTMSWLSGCRRLHRRYERKPEHFLGFTAIAVMLICLRRLGVSAGR